MLDFYVYRLVDPRTDETFYIGKGKLDRINEHEREARRGVSSPKCIRIREIESAGLKVTKRKVAFFSEENAAYSFEATSAVSRAACGRQDLIDAILRLHPFDKWRERLLPFGVELSRGG